MAGGNMKPLDGYGQGGSILNFPVPRDGSVVPVVSPLAAATATQVVVPRTGCRANFVSTTAFTIVMMNSAAVEETGVITVPANTVVVIDTGGMNGRDELGPDRFFVTPGAGSVSFWFDCAKPNGD